MLKVGITGGIGSGKSTVAQVFSLLNIPVYFADRETRNLMNEDPLLIADIIKHFGAESYLDNKLNRSYLAAVVFNDKEKLTLLNSLTHPATIRHANEWMKKHSEAGNTIPYTLKEAALIFESGSSAFLDFIIGVDAPRELRILRTMERDNISRDEVILRMDRQMDESIKMKLCDAVIMNDEYNMIIPQVLALHQQLAEKSAPAPAPFTN